MNKEWFVFKGTHHLGPFSVEEIVDFYENGEINDKTLIWKEGVEKWFPLSKVAVFQFLFNANEASNDEAPPPIPPVPHNPQGLKLPRQAATPIIDDELPPPIPLDAILDTKGAERIKSKGHEKKSKLKKALLIMGSLLFAAVIGWFAIAERDARIQLKIKGIMPVYLEKLEMMATSKTPAFEVALALSLDSLTLWGSTNYPGEIFVNIQLKSLPNRILGTEDVAVSVKGVMNDHLGKFNRMILTQGSKFLPGEYSFHVEARQTHFINRQFRSLSNIDFFKTLNKTYSYDGTALIYAGTPREFEKRIHEYSETIQNERLKPFLDKLERVRTLESILNATSQNYLMELEKAKNGKGIAPFEAKFIQEISPLLQTLVTKASELSKDPKFNDENAPRPAVAPYSEQFLLGKQIGELASDMITITSKYKKLSDQDKSDLKSQFDKRARGIKLQIDLNIKLLEEQIQKISK